MTTTATSSNQSSTIVCSIIIEVDSGKKFGKLLVRYEYSEKLGENIVKLLSHKHKNEVHQKLLTSDEIKSQTAQMYLGKNFDTKCLLPCTEFMIEDDYGRLLKFMVYYAKLKSISSIEGSASFIQLEKIIGKKAGDYITIPGKKSTYLLTQSVVKAIDSITKNRKY